MKSMLKSLMSVAVAALAFTSCSTDATDEVVAKGELKTLKVTATIDQTRTTLAGDHVKLNWSNDDVILFYIGEEATTFNKVNPSTGGTIDNVAYENGNTVYANYSIDNEKYSKEGVKKAQIYIKNAQAQTAANEFAGENLPMIAKGEIQDGAVTLAFKPFGCVLVFNVYGTVENETVQSIKFDPGVPCCGYQNCDLTIGASDYIGQEFRTSATVTLGTPAAIGTAKPENTTMGENQVYLVVAPFNYTAATFTVTTEAGKTYTFKTANGIDCSTNSARVVNLNLAKAAEMQPAIVVTPVPQQTSDGGDKSVEGIDFKNIETDGLKVADVVGVYSNEELTESTDVAWLTIRENNPDLFTEGKLYYTLAQNTTTASRTAYIGIKCAGVQAAIAVTQVAPGASTAKYFVKVTKTPDDWSGDYLIVYEDTKAKALDGSLSKIDVANDYIDVTITEQGGILSDKTTNASLVTITKVESGYLLQAAKGQYIYSSSDANQLKESADKNTAAQYPNSIKIDGGSAKIESKGSVLRFNSTSNQMRFRYYKSGSYANQKAIQLYKLQE